MLRTPTLQQIRYFCNPSLVIILLLAAAILSGTSGFAAGPKAYVGNFKDNTISVIDLDQKRVTATVPVPRGPHGIAITPDNRWVYVASDGASTVSVIDTATDKVVANVEVGKNPHGVAATSDGKLVLVGVYDTDSVALIDTASRKVVGSVPIGKPHNIAIHPNGRTAYVGSQTPGKFALAIIDLSERKLSSMVPLEKTPRGIPTTFQSSIWKAARSRRSPSAMRRARSRCKARRGHRVLQAARLSSATLPSSLPSYKSRLAIS
jgi:YVTN family beta-propeller protein